MPGRRFSLSFHDFLSKLVSICKNRSHIYAHSDAVIYFIIENVTSMTDYDCFRKQKSSYMNEYDTFLINAVL